MDLKLYRKDIRALAFLSISFSNSSNVLIVEGVNDRKIYAPFLGGDNIRVLESDFSISKIKGGKSGVKNIKAIIDIISPNNKKIAYLIDDDFDNEEEKNNLFVTDYHSLENYPIVHDTKFEYFHDIKTLPEEKIVLLKKSIYYKDSSEVWESLNHNLGAKQFFNIETDVILKKGRGKTLLRLLKIKNNTNMFEVSSMFGLRKSMHVLDRIVDYFNK